jgi:Rieske Fe-S protein
LYGADSDRAFDAAGKVIQGPANSELAEIDEE